MEMTNTPAGVVVQTPQNVVAASAAPIQQQIPINYGGGGGSIDAMIRNINWWEVTVGIVSITALFFIIKHYKQKSMLMVKDSKDVKGQIDVLKSDVDEIKETLSYNNSGSLGL